MIETLVKNKLKKNKKQNLIEVVLGENGSLGRVIIQMFPSGDVVLYVKNEEDRNMLNHPTNANTDSGMIRWLNKDNSPKNHLNGRKDNGDKVAELRIKSISEESVTIRYDGFTIKDKGHIKTGNKGVKNVDNKTQDHSTYTKVIIKKMCAKDGSNRR